MINNLSLLIFTAGLLGLLVGSFLNVVILRLPDRLMFAWRRDAREILQPEEHQLVEAIPTPPDLVFARSHCPKCRHQLSWWENVPVLSFLLLRGQCRSCSIAISWQYPFVELLTGVMSAFVVWHWGWSAQTLVALVLTWGLIAASGIDIRTQLLPDQITLPLLWLGLLCGTQSLFVPATESIIGAALGYLSLWSVYWLFKLSTGKEGMGYGDFKLLAALGAFCGVQGLLVIVLLSSVLGAIIGALILSLQKKDTATPIPFGPYLALAGWIQLVFGQAILSAYHAFVGL
jgi:leader peptidase (prepilin peptidase)/N-methyltransferase